MNKSNLLISSLTAFAIVGSIGLAVAQTTTPNPPTTPGDSGAPTQASPNTGTVPSSPAMPNQPSMNNSGSTTNSSGSMVTERAPQIDRN